MWLNSRTFIPEEWKLSSIQKVAQDCSQGLYNNCQRLETTKVSLNRWMVKQVGYTHTVEYYSAIQRIIIGATTWMDLKSIMLNKQRQSQNIRHYMILFIEHSQNDKITVMENRCVVSRAQGGERVVSKCNWEEWPACSLWCWAVLYLD